MNVRKAILSGSWYPENAGACENEIKGFLQEHDTTLFSRRKLTGGIVPHAGWYFSGSIACNVIDCLREETPPDVLVVLGMHLHTGSPRYIMADGAWETPFGPLFIASDLARTLMREYHFTIETPEHFSHDNTIEVQLPFIKYFFPDVKLLPIGAPPVKDSFEMGKAAVRIAAEMGLRLKIIGSTDLTHYGSNYGFSPKGSGTQAHTWVRNENDHRVIEAMLALDPERVLQEAAEHHNACCAGAAATAIAACKDLGTQKAETIAYATSFEKSPGDSFVGYVGIVFGK